MNTRNWSELTAQAFSDRKFVCVGLDPKFDERWSTASNAVKNDIMNELFQFCLSRVRAVGRIAGFIKPNWAFFVQYGWRGLQVLEQVTACIREHFPQCRRYSRHEGW